VSRHFRRRSGWPVRFRMTRAGWVFLAVSLMICGGAANVQAPLLFLVFGAMMGLLHVSAIIARRMMKATDLRRDVPGRVWQNQTVHLGYYLCNLRKRGSLLGLEARELAPLGIQAAGAYCMHLAPGSVFRAGGRFAARSRGRIRMNVVRVMTAFPFGLIAARRDFHCPADIVVWPGRGRLKGRLLQVGAVEISRSAPSPFSGGQDEFFGLREYRAGDNPRWIAWKRSATRASPVIREMARPLPEALMVVLDTRLPAGSGGTAGASLAREKMIRFAGTLIDYALARGYLVGAALARSKGVEYHRPAPGRGQLRTLLDALADIEDAVERPLDEALARVEPGVARGSVVAVLSADSAREPGGSARTAAPFDCRRFILVHNRNLEDFFEDDPLAEPASAGGAACQ
jgi:uncharacterized protein (DUF58 family)